MAARSAVVRVAGQLLGEPLVVRFQPGRFGERRFPVSLQLPGDEAVLGLGELVLAPRPVGRIAGALDPLPPELVQHGALVLGLGGCGHGDLQRGGSHRFQDLAGDVVVERRPGDVLAGPAGPVVGLVEGARVAVHRARPALAVAVRVADRHAVPAAAAAAQQPGQQRRPVPGRARRGGRLLVGGHPGDVRLVLLLGDVGGQPAGQQDQPLGAVLHHPPCAGPAGCLAARVDLAAPPREVARVDRVMQHVLQRLPGRAAPLQFPLRRAGVDPDRQLDLLADEVAQHPVNSPQPG